MRAPRDARGSGGDPAIDQHDQLLALGDIATLCGITLGFFRRTAPRRDHLASRQERPRHIDGLIEQPTRIVAQVENVAGKLILRYLLRYVGNRFLQPIFGLFVERTDPDIADVAAIGMEADRPHLDDFTLERNVDRLVRALAFEFELGRGVKALYV